MDGRRSRSARYCSAKPATVLEAACSIRRRWASCRTVGGVHSSRSTRVRSAASQASASILVENVRECRVPSAIM